MTETEQRGGACGFTVGKRWVRMAAYYGSPPGSHIGFWRTNSYGLRGLNLRVARRITGPCLTMFVHTRPVRRG